MSGIYCIKNKHNGKCYVGQSIDVETRWRHHISDLNNNRHINRHLQSSWNKHGQEAFEFFIIERVERDQLNEREIFWISKLDAVDNGYNLTLGGEGTCGRPTSQETRHKISRALKGHKVSDYAIQRTKEANTGKSFTQEHKDKIAQNSSKYWLGKSLPEDVKEKMSKAKQKPVVCVETGIVYDSITIAGESTGINYRCIGNCCNKKQNKAGGFHWQYTIQI